ncbi:HNH endonuclease signature motif containing protein [Arthrobacter sp. ISL-30]|uniref:HNH endonuclease n=1 Tax=Arthrobacter sp. ISL-30 TaxID=2819109 RepID=UPI001BE8570A|nr:HNH endonuclease signature motif containing protein [Arthrobacter sp. ISL-30]MBT2515390.1 DUF222 domain-containing protein [Arthrobacter sp. ISL-30]
MSGSTGLGSPLEVLRECSATLLDAAGTAVDEVRLLDGGEAGEYACLVEELSRIVEFLQIVAAGLAQRVRQEALASPASGITVVTSGGWGGEDTSATAIGWRSSETSAAAGSIGGLRTSETSAPAATGGWGTSETGTSEGSWGRIGAVSGGAASDKESRAANRAGAVSGGVPARAYGVGPGAAEFRNTAEYLRACLRISAGEARRRLALAGAVLPRTGLTGQPMPPVREELAEAMTTGAVSSKAATQITVTLENIRPLTDNATMAQVEHSLTSTAIDHDPEFLASVAKRWTNAIDQDGGEPSEELLRQRQGAFLRRPRNGLQHLEVFATPDQFEHLITVMNTATNPRLPNTSTNTTGTTDAAVTGTGAATAEAAGMTGAGAGSTASGGEQAATGDKATAPVFSESDGVASLDRRTRAQRMLDGIIGACKIALSSGTLPAAGGLRPQILVTIGYKELLADLNNTTTDANGMTGTNLSNTWTSGSSTCVNGIASIDINRAGSGTGTSGIAGAGIAGAGINRAGSGSGVFAFTGPVSAAVIRKMACDAELLPVVMGTEGQVLDIGRTSRVFPPHIRKAITARDLGCAFPGCTMPAPWCEAHHITYWSHGGTTSTSNGTLLCSHHHHLIHKEHWQIQVQNDIPWFIPPPHIDPQRKPRRNHYFRQ